MEVKAGHKKVTNEEMKSEPGKKRLYCWLLLLNDGVTSDLLQLTDEHAFPNQKKGITIKHFWYNTFDSFSLLPGELQPMSLSKHSCYHDRLVPYRNTKFKTVPTCGNFLFD